MADFVAVIRKAVDGLANNTPEMRAKVYEKARGAVQRQLENMKPRPSDDLLRRQMMKIDAAIAEVESEHAEAIEADEDEVLLAETPEQPEEHGYAAEEPSAAWQEPAPAEEEPEEQYVPAPAATGPVREEEEAPAWQAEERYEPQAPAYEEPVAEVPPAEARYEPWSGAEHGEDPVAAEEPYREEEQEPAAEEPQPAAAAHYASSIPDNLYEQPERTRFVDDGRPAAEDEWQQPVDDAAELPRVAAVTWPGHTEEPSYTEEQRYENEPSPVHDDEERQPVSNWRDMPEELPDVPPALAAHEPDEERRVASEPSWEPLSHDDHRPAGNDAASGQYAASPFDDDFRTADDDRHQPAPQAAETHQTIRPGHFEEVNWDGLEPVSDKPVQEKKQAEKDPQGERSPWEDLEELIGYDGGKGGGRDAAAAGAAASPGIFDNVAPVSYTQARKKKRNYAAPVLALLGVALLAGGGYALWLNRDAMNDMVGGLIQAAKPGTQEQASTPPAGQPAGTSTPPAAQTPPASNNGNAVPGDDGAVKGTKFTQRLMSDGREVDAGEAGAVVATGTEGQSVAQQNEAPPPAAGQGATPPQAGATPPATQTPPPAAQAPLPAGSERVFLYEERLGQTVPTTLEGSVSWSLQEEATANGAPEKVVQGRIEVPGRGLSALVTFRRNMDSSLPASHLFEIVFSVSAGFDGGAIESVQRIAMKQTEQDRGNALVAVPARITDDFHMIALNDFPDARASNLELLRTRNWIDIPVTYRNGRRALLTMPKGAEGTKAFDEALSSWAAQPATSQ